MQIRNKLSLYFTLTSSALMLVIMFLIYILFANFSINNFYTALHERTIVAAQLYLEADEISSTSLQKIKDKFVISLPEETIRLYDSTDQLSFTSDTGKKWNNKTIDEVRRKKYIAYRDGPQQVVGIYYEDNQGNFVILAAATDIEGKRQRKNLLQIMAVLFGSQILIQFLAGRWFSKRALLPVQLVNAQVSKISATDLHLRVTTNNEKDELGLLATNFNNLLERLEVSFGLQKMFVANASHELLTPVTNMMGEIEVALGKERTADEYRKLLVSVLSDTERLHDIIRNFLMLANAENTLSLQQSEPVRLDEMMWEIKDLFDRQPDSVVEIQMNDLPEDEGRLYFRTNKTLLIHAISNIIQNGVKFSSGQPVTCSLHFTDHTFIVKVTDKGVGIPPDQVVHIFEPFFRISNGHVPGHGIGLYISGKIIALLGGTIHVQSQPGLGSSFNISFTQ